MMILMPDGCGQRHNATRSGLPAVISQPVTRLRPPDLIIQDELHLISGALGTTVGLFEAAVDELCTWRADSVLTGPKIVASTATTKRAREQVSALFARDLAVFPPPCSTCPTRSSPARSGHAEDARAALPRDVRARGTAEVGRDPTGGDLADRWADAVRYLRPGGRPLHDRGRLLQRHPGTRGNARYLDDDVTTRVRSHGRPRGLSDRITSSAGMLAIEELTSRISSAEISNVLKRLEVGFSSDLDTSARRRSILAETADAFKTKRDRHPLAERTFERLRADRVPVDVVLATSMLQVGVDVSRFGLMVVTGQPKNTAEYIQASSRVGRKATSRPGRHAVQLVSPPGPVRTMRTSSTTTRR